jgi:hypothetical protein
MRRLMFLTCVLSVACVHTNAAVLDVTQRFAPICSDGVKVFSDSSRVGQPYQEVALLNSKGQTGTTSEAGMINSQRQKAAELGANGIILSGIREPSAGTKIAGALLGTGSERKGSAMAIYIPGDSIRVRTACDGTNNRSD